MAGSDYHRCAVCSGKAFYDADVEYGSAVVLALCGGCAKTHALAVTPALNAPYVPDGDT